MSLRSLPRFFAPLLRLSTNSATIVCGRTSVPGSRSCLLPAFLLHRLLAGPVGAQPGRQWHPLPPYLGKSALDALASGARAQSALDRIPAEFYLSRRSAEAA